MTAVATDFSGGGGNATVCCTILVAGLIGDGGPTNVAVPIFRPDRRRPAYDRKRIGDVIRRNRQSVQLLRERHLVDRCRRNQSKYDVVWHVRDAPSRKNDPGLRNSCDSAPMVLALPWSSLWLARSPDG